MVSGTQYNARLYVEYTAYHRQLLLFLVCHARGSPTQDLCWTCFSSRATGLMAYIHTLYTDMSAQPSALQATMQYCHSRLETLQVPTRAMCLCRWFRFA